MKRLCLMILCCFFLTATQAQVIYNSSGKSGKTEYKENAKKKGFDPQRLVIGGGFGFGFGSGILNLEVSPEVGYRLTDWFSAGVRLGYQYNWIKDGQGYVNMNNGMVEGKNINYHIIAPGLWVRGVVWQNIFLFGEYEYNEFTYKSFYGDLNPKGYSSERLWDHANCLLVGAGLRQPISDRASMYMEAFYDVLQNISANQRVDNSGQEYSVSPYANTVGFRVGILFGF